MVGTIIPMVHGEPERQKKILLLSGHMIGYLIGSVSIGVALAMLGILLGADRLSAAQKSVIFGTVSFALAMRELGLKAIPVPQWDVQVPARWKLWPRAAAVLTYGIVLGGGVFTKISFATFYIPVLWCLCCGSSKYGMLCMLGYGLGRALPFCWLGLYGPDTAADVVAVLGQYKKLIRAVNACFLFSVSAGLIAIVFFKVSGLRGGIP